MKESHTNRREFLQLSSGLALAGGTVWLAPSLAAPAADSAVARLGDGLIELGFDTSMRMRVLHAGAPRPFALCGWQNTDGLLRADGHRLDRFALRAHAVQHIDGPFGPGTQLALRGEHDGVEKQVVVELFERYPGFACFRISYRNLAQTPLHLRGWTALSLQMAPDPAERADAPFWSYCGSTHADRRDWVRAVRPGFNQANFLGMDASDYGGGTPILDVWRRDGGVAIGHLELTPRLLSLPLTCDARDAAGSITEQRARTLGPTESFELPQLFMAAHRGDYFVVLDTYRRMMGELGVTPPASPASAYEPIWCAWGYERSCTPALIEDTLPKVRELGLKWAVIDDGWQSNVGDWNVNRTKYPNGEADFLQLVQKIHAQELKARLWWSPLGAAPGSDLLHDHADMLLLDVDGAPQLISWWNSFYLCPAYQPTIDYTLGLVRRFIGQWGFEGLKIDGQHLNSVAPCYNPAHRHARPEESVEKLQDFFQAIYQTAMAINPNAVVEMCPCGTAYSFFNMRSFNQAPASDPESSWQVRLKGKTLKALMGPSAAFAGDHVELSDGGDDFASTVGIGAIVSTKFTWPHDPKPTDSFLLTPEREALWRHWISLYNERELPRGLYRGELYDIGFDKPEAHVVEKAGRFYYAFYAREFAGAVPLKGLRAGRYRVRDYVNDRELGEVAGEHARLSLQFQGSLLLEAIPV